MYSIMYGNTEENWKVALKYTYTTHVCLVHVFDNFNR